MHPIAFTIFGHEVRWYGVMAAIGFMFAVMIMQKLKKRASLTDDDVSNITMLGMVFGILGARVFYVVQFWEQFADDYFEIPRIDHGGLVFYGGFIFALIAIIIYCKLKKKSVVAVLDVTAPAIAVAHACGRIGCFLNGCCFGHQCSEPWGVVYPEGSMPWDRYHGTAIHPVQLYETFGNIIIFCILMYCFKKFKKGQVAALYLSLYGVLRFTDEFFRGDHTDRFFEGLTRAQFIATFLVPAGIIWFRYLGAKKKKKKNNK
jgi:phosphatidylglycerol:prolipoprotein diacylglycerol transferase